MDRNGLDYFSFLPDALLLIIISFLPFKDAVRTSVLSTRWRHLWYSTRTVELDEDAFFDNTALTHTYVNRRRFIEFINHWWGNFGEPSLENFRLVFRPMVPLDAPVAQSCVQFAVHVRQVSKSLHLNFCDPIVEAEDKELNITTHPTYGIHLPFFDSHGEIETLELRACPFNVTLFNRFSALKNVFLGWIRLPGCSLSGFIAKCPVLETLHVRRCWNVGDVDVDAGRLKSLVLDKLSGPYEYVTVDAPLLRFFKYCGPCVYMQMEYNRHMVEAVFDFGLQKEWDDGEESEMMCNLLIEFWSAKVLTVCSYMLQVLPRSEVIILKPSLSVTHLILQTNLHFKEYYGITFFLNSCPRLETLTLDLSCPRRIFEECQPPYKIEEHPFFSNLYYPSCVVTTLSTVKVKGYKGVPDEQVVLKYLLKYAKVLRYLFISLSKDKGADEIDLEPTYRENLVNLLRQDMVIGSPGLQVFLDDNIPD